MRVLIVEDEHKIANTIRDGLQQNNYAADVAYDGKEGYDLASTEDYDVIILDLMLPGMDGFTVCEKLRKEENIHTPILMLTARSSTEDKVKGLDAGADDYLAKPFSFSELMARIRALSRRPKKSLEQVLKIKDLELNTLTKQVKRSGKILDISKKEFSILEHLMRNKNAVVSRDQIISHVWDYDADVLPNTVEVFIGFLRSKIDKPFKKKPKIIKTVRGFGYTIRD